MQQFKVNVKPSTIEYKKIDVERLRTRGFDATEVEFHYEKEYITKEMIPELELEAKETVVINVGVGNGKTYLMYQLIARYVKLGYTCIIASPFKGLARKDHEQVKAVLIENDLDPDKVGHYELSLDVLDRQAEIKKPIQAVTIHWMVGNPGEGLMQSYEKRSYLEELFLHVKTKEKGLILFFDEIHAALDCFRNEEYIFRLLQWKQQNVQKAYVMSATFTEAGIVATEYISHLTEKKLKIFNCERKRLKSTDRANLNLHFVEKGYSSNNLQPLYPMMDVLRGAKEKGQSINLLSYSKNLVNSLCNKKSEDKLAQMVCSLGPNKLTSDTTAPKEYGGREAKFEKEKFNIGTSFSTGESIDIENSTLIIIVPHVPEKYNVSPYGIFTSGEPSIIQTIARLRKKGDIHVFLTKPEKLLKGTYLDEHQEPLSAICPMIMLMYDMQLMLGTGNVDDETDSKYSPKKLFWDLVSHQEQLPQFSKSYWKKRHFLLPTIEAVDKSQVRLAYPSVKSDSIKLTKMGRISYHEELKEVPGNLIYPSIEKEILERSEVYFCKSHPRWGNEISPYIVWAALNDQFCNCKLHTIYKHVRSTQSLVIRQEHLTEDLLETVFTELERTKDEKAHNYALRIVHALQEGYPLQDFQRRFNICREKKEVVLTRSIVKNQTLLLQSVFGICLALENSTLETLKKDQPSSTSIKDYLLHVFKNPEQKYKYGALYDWLLGYEKKWKKAQTDLDITLKGDEVTALAKIVKELRRSDPIFHSYSTFKNVSSLEKIRLALSKSGIIQAEKGQTKGKKRKTFYKYKGSGILGKTKQQ